MEWAQLAGKTLHGSIYPFADDEEVISLLHTKVYVFSDSVLCFGKVNEIPQSNIAWEDRLTWFKRSPEYKALDTIDGEPMEFEWNIFPGFTTMQLCFKVQELSRLSVNTRKKFSGRINLHVDVQRHHGDLKTMNKNANQVLSSWPGGWGPQGIRATGGGGLARVPNLHVCKHFCTWSGHTQGEKDE